MSIQACRETVNTKQHLSPDGSQAGVTGAPLALAGRAKQALVPLPSEICLRICRAAANSPLDLWLLSRPLAKQPHRLSNMAAAAADNSLMRSYCPNGAEQAHKGGPVLLEQWAERMRNKPTVARDYIVNLWQRKNDGLPHASDSVYADFDFVLPAIMNAGAPFGCAAPALRAHVTLAHAAMRRAYEATHTTSYRTMDELLFFQRPDYSLEAIFDLLPSELQADPSFDWFRPKSFSRPAS